MFKKIVDVLKEVFWLKPSPKSKRKKSVKKSTTSSRKVRSLGTPRRPVKRTQKLKKDMALEKETVKPISKPVARKVKKPQLDPALKPMGVITHYFERINVAVVKINHGTVLIGDRVTIVSGSHKFLQKIWSMQIESQDVKIAKKGQLIGIKVDKPVVVGDVVYK